MCDEDTNFLLTLFTLKAEGFKNYISFEKENRCRFSIYCSAD